MLAVSAALEMTFTLFESFRNMKLIMTRFTQPHTNAFIYQRLNVFFINTRRVLEMMDYAMCNICGFFALLTSF